MLGFLVYLRLIVEVGDFPPAGGRPRLGLVPGRRGALATLVTMSLRTLSISAVSVGGPVSVGGCRTSELWARITAGRVMGLVAVTTFLTMDLRILEITSVSVGEPVSAVGGVDSLAWVRLGIVGAGVGAK